MSVDLDINDSFSVRRRHNASAKGSNPCQPVYSL